jgi:glycosyltransferase involved in cell wall biosynthesis
MTKADREEGGRRLHQAAPPIAPLVSIVIVVFRCREALSSLLANIPAQEPDGLEIIVIDGGSDDGSIDLLREFSGKIDYWISEADAGIYDAMNKGIAAARGEYIWHLNAGDKARKIPWVDLRQCLEDKIDVLSCCVLIDGAVIFKPRARRRLLIENTWHHQGTFYRRTTMTRYDTGYRVYGDFDLNQRLSRAGRSVRLSTEVVAEHSNDGISVSGRKQYFKEFLRSIRVNSGILFIPPAYAWARFSSLRMHLKVRTRIKAWCGNLFARPGGS